MCTIHPSGIWPHLVRSPARSPRICRSLRWRGTASRRTAACLKARWVAKPTQQPNSAEKKGAPLWDAWCPGWVALNGKVYDLTEFMDRHPGGPTTILAWAGKDASKLFNDIHKGAVCNLTEGSSQRCQKPYPPVIVPLGTPSDYPFPLPGELLPLE